MKTQLRKLNRLIKIDCLNPDNFSVITVYINEITFMGDYTAKLSTKLAVLFGKGEANASNGFIEFSKYNINVILT